MSKHPLLLVVLIISLSISCSHSKSSEFVNVALRDSGNKLLLYNNDSTSLVLPILKLDENKYELSFEKKLFIEPDSLVNIINHSFEITDLSRNYIVEVINCETKEVVYSYQIRKDKEEHIIPCLGRNLPLQCYKIQVLFAQNASLANTNIFYVILTLGLLGMVLILIKKRKEKPDPSEKINYITLGNYKFYDDQNKLSKGEILINLTTKESQLLKIFSQNQNVIIKREQLIKEVWEDNGIIVGRSLDAFISKIRKKFENDHSINIVNIHGVGYKLEVID